MKNLFYNIKFKFKTYNPFIISAMGRSGIWYNREFFYFYNQLLIGKSKDEIKNFLVNNKFKIKYWIDLNSKNFNFNCVLIQHFLCPGFDEYKGKEIKKWNQLNFYSSHIPAEYTEKMLLKKIDKKINPFKNKKIKIIFYYRNPYDQLTAYWNAIQDHVDNNLLFYYDKNLKQKKKFLNIQEFIRNGGTDMYIKHYLSFYLMKKKFPENIKFFSYENLVNNPEKNFSEVLNFIGHKDHANSNNKFFLDALLLSSKDSIVELENKIGHAMSQAYKNKSSRQLKDAKIGKWKSLLNDDDLKYINNQLESHDLDLNNFIFG